MGVNARQKLGGGTPLFHLPLPSLPPSPSPPPFPTPLTVLFPLNPAMGSEEVLYTRPPAGPGGALQPNVFWCTYVKLSVSEDRFLVFLRQNLKVLLHVDLF